MHSFGLKPTIQTHILIDGSIFPTLQTMWEGGVRTKALSKTITEADFYFAEQRVAIFVDSVAHHSTEEAIVKDKAIDKKLKAKRIRSIRISGLDIMNSPIDCAKRVFNAIENQV
jgi:very-short-patch-repair endonuclease